MVRPKKAKPAKKVDSAEDAQQKSFLKTATGAESADLQHYLVRQALGSLWFHEDITEEQRNEKIQAALAAMEAIKPQDELEGMLAAQMFATHNAAMECLRRAMIPEQPLPGRDHDLKHASKLLSIYARQLEALGKHRGKGRQKITVEHVNVEPGGQAIVGNVELGSKEAEAAEDQAQLVHSEDPVMPQLNEQSAPEKTPVSSEEKKRDE